MSLYNKTVYKNPAKTYLLSLSSEVNTYNSGRALKRLCKKMSGCESYLTFDWASFDYSYLINLKACMLDDKYEPSSINTYLALLKGVAKECWRQKLICIDTYLQIKDVKLVSYVRGASGRALAPEEISEIISHCTKQKTKAGLRNAAMIALSYGAGLRVHELAKLNISNYNGDSISVIGKGNKERINPLPTYVASILDKWLAVRDVEHDGIFLKIFKGDNISKHRLYKGSIRNVFIKIINKANIEHFSPHDLRRSFATNLIGADVDLFTVQKLMGHANVETTRRYDLRHESVKADAVQLLPF
jgi:integrase